MARTVERLCRNLRELCQAGHGNLPVVIEQGDEVLSELPAGYSVAVVRVDWEDLRVYHAGAQAPTDAEEVAAISLGA